MAWLLGVTASVSHGLWLPPRCKARTLLIAGATMLALGLVLARLRARPPADAESGSTG